LGPPCATLQRHDDTVRALAKLPRPDLLLYDNNGASHAIMNEYLAEQVLELLEEHGDNWKVPFDDLLNLIKQRTGFDGTTWLLSEQLLGGIV